MQTKLCNQCGTAKPLEEFTRSKKSNNYKGSSSEYHTYCKSCNAERARNWRKEHPNYRGSGKLKQYPKEDLLLISAIRQRLADAKTRCKKRNMHEPTVTVDDLYQLYLSQNRCCALTGEPLCVEKEHPLCLSLDQKDPSKGYILANVQWLAWAVNRAKGDLHIEDFYDMCELVLNKKVQRLSP